MNRITQINILRSILLLSLFLTLISCISNSCFKSKEGPNLENINPDLAVNNPDSLRLIDSLTTGYFSQSFAVVSPHLNAIHSIKFNKDLTFDYRILDERHGMVDIYQGIWIYSKDTIRIAVTKEWTTTFRWEPIYDSSDQEVSRKTEIVSNFMEGSEGYYPFSEDILTYNYNQYRGGTICFPKRYQTQNCLLKIPGSFLHKIVNTAIKN